jgi:hypothetical protein
MNRNSSEALLRTMPARTPGGCDDCDAFQILERVGLRIWKITVHHDPDCPALAQRGAAS